MSPIRQNAQRIHERKPDGPPSGFQRVEKLDTLLAGNQKLLRLTGSPCSSVFPPVPPFLLQNRSQSGFALQCIFVRHMSGQKWIFTATAHRCVFHYFLETESPMDPHRALFFACLSEIPTDSAISPHGPGAQRHRRPPFSVHAVFFNRVLTQFDPQARLLRQIDIAVGRHFNRLGQ